MDIISQPLLTLVGVFLTVTGVVVGHLLSARIQSQATKAQSLASAKTNEQTMIDQLQEEVAKNLAELTRYREAADSRVLLMEKRMMAMEERDQTLMSERDKLRDYAHTLRTDIFNRKEPPPRDWPPGILR